MEWDQDAGNSGCQLLSKTVIWMGAGIVLPKMGKRKERNPNVLATTLVGCSTQIPDFDYKK